MTFSSCLTDRDSILVLDASVIINLLATGYAGAILQAVPAPIVVTDNVIREIEQGAVNGRPEPKQLSELIHNQTLKREELSGIALEHFFDLVSGSTAASLGDGEAATLALAHSNGFTAVIDEKSNSDFLPTLWNTETNYNSRYSCLRARAYFNRR